MESLIGSKDGWYDGQGTFHEWTRESVDAIIECSYGTDFVREDGKSIHLGDYSTKEELEQAIKEAVESGQLTKQEAKDIYLQ